MIGETKQDQAALYALGLLDGDEAARFRAELKGNPELQQWVDDFTASSAALVETLPTAKAPAEVWSRILTEVQAEQPATPRFQFVSHKYFPWALAAGLAVLCGGLTISVRTTANDATRLSQEAEAARSERTEAVAAAGQLQEQIKIVTNERDRLLGERSTLQKTIADLQNRDALSRMKIATLRSQVATYARVVAAAVWDDEKQSGLVDMSNLPRPASDKDYQLWVIDPQYPKPVSGGVVPVSAGGAARLRFKADRPIKSATKFAVSIERKGGAPAPEGPIVLLSN